MSHLWVEFIDEAYELEPEGSLSFGREGELVVDDENPFMHRLVGEFIWHRDAWWVRNDSRQAEIDVLTTDGKRASIPPAGAELLHGEGVVRFEAGVTTYEIDFRADAQHGVPERGAGATEADGSDPASMTRDFGKIRLNVEQRAMLALMCESRLRNPAAQHNDIAPNAEIAHRLGWSLRKFDRKLDYICRRLDEMGLRGVRGSKGVEALDRRAVVVDHMIRSGLITVLDLEGVG